MGGGGGGGGGSACVLEKNGGHMGGGGCVLQIKVGHTREGGGESDVNRADHTRCTVYVLIFTVYTFLLHSQMNPRPRKLIHAKNCPGTVSLPVSY